MFGFLVSLVYPTESRLIWTVVCAAICIVWLHIPILNIPIMFASAPLFTRCARFGHTSQDVEWWAFGPLLKSPLAFAVFFGYYALIAYVLLFPLGFVTKG